MNRKSKSKLDIHFSLCYSYLLKKLWSRAYKNEEIRGRQIMGMKKGVTDVFCLMFVLISSYSSINGEPGNILFLSGIRARQGMKYGKKKKYRQISFFNRRWDYMLIFFGTKTIRKKIKNGLRRHIYCSGCRCMQELQEFRRIKYFTLYFIPLFPIERGKPVLTCPVCDESYVLSPEHYYSGTTENYSSSPAGETIPAKIIINCMHCGKKCVSLMWRRLFW
jgi:hypothetical protein